MTDVTAVAGARCVVLDWSGVRHVDSSAITAVGKFLRFIFYTAALLWLVPESWLS